MRMPKLFGKRYTPEEGFAINAKILVANAHREHGELAEGIEVIDLE